MQFGGQGGRGRKKNMNFELNLVPFIDVLSVCICFLLVTAVFINLGSIHVSQAVGSEKLDETPSKGSITVSMGGQGDVRFEVKDVKGFTGDLNLVTVKGSGGKVNFAKTEEWIKAFSTRFADVKTVLLMPNPTSKYDDMIQLMAQFKANSVDQIGIAPL